MSLTEAPAPPQGLAPESSPAAASLPRAVPHSDAGPGSPWHHLDRPWLWLLLTAFLVCWNGALGWYGSPLTLVQTYDGVQYQLLARNRLLGHDEVGDRAHTVRLEGRHPMWRPGLVWVTEGLARLTGSVRRASCLASALAVSLLELLLLVLALRCFGPVVFLTLLALIVAPVAFSAWMLRLAVGQGPEPWAAAALLAGFALLVQAWQSGSLVTAVSAGIAAGFAEWFRTGNLVIFAAPCLVYGLAALVRRRGRLVLVPALSLAGFLALAAVGGQLVPSPVNKTTANLWGNLLETHGLKLALYSGPGEPHCSYLGGLFLAPGGREVWYDAIIRRVRAGEAPDPGSTSVAALSRLYLGRLGEVIRGGCRGLRVFVGGWLLAGFFLGVALALARRQRADLHTLALASGALAFYAGPVVLLKGDDPTHYTLVVLPLVVLVAARGVVQGLGLLAGLLRLRAPAVGGSLPALCRSTALVALPALLSLSALYYAGAVRDIRVLHARAEAEQARFDGLGLQGQRIACRNMSWVVDRPVETVLLPYAPVEELEGYARAQGLDGVLFWSDEATPFLATTPYGMTPASIDRAMKTSKLFGPARTSGGWVYYPVERTQEKERP